MIERVRERLYLDRKWVVERGLSGVEVSGRERERALVSGAVVVCKDSKRTPA